jgi:hypothetical protein
MPRNFILNASAASSAVPRKSFYSTFDEALRGARFKISNGAALVWIIDRDGNLILSADQTAARLDSEDLVHTQPTVP